MVKMLTTALAIASSLVPAQGQKDMVKPPLAGEGTIIVKLLPHRDVRTDGNYVIEDEKQDAQQRYDELKAALDERFAKMFELKAALDRQQDALAAKWEEYYAMHEKYNRELKKIIAAWVTESNYLSEPQPTQTQK